MKRRFYFYNRGVNKTLYAAILNPETGERLLPGVQSTLSKKSILIFLIAAFLMRLYKSSVYCPIHSLALYK